eukprot:CCRYP_001856-RA/>CCRYP_001856-RA protein AED:0.47 eAED:0.79 QI:0/0.5/0/1/0/0/3/0/556
MTSGCLFDGALCFGLNAFEYAGGLGTTELSDCRGVSSKPSEEVIHGRLSPLQPLFVFHLLCRIDDTVKRLAKFPQPPLLSIRLAPRSNGMRHLARPHLLLMTFKLLHIRPTQPDQFGMHEQIPVIRRPSLDPGPSRGLIPTAHGTASHGPCIGIVSNEYLSHDDNIGGDEGVQFQYFSGHFREGQRWRGTGRREQYVVAFQGGIASGEARSLNRPLCHAVVAVAIPTPHEIKIGTSQRRFLRPTQRWEGHGRPPVFSGGRQLTDSVSVKRGGLLDLLIEQRRQLRSLHVRQTKHNVCLGQSLSGARSDMVHVLIRRRNGRRFDRTVHSAGIGRTLPQGSRASIAVHAIVAKGGDIGILVQNGVEFVQSHLERGRRTSHVQRGVGGQSRLDARATGGEEIQRGVEQRVGNVVPRPVLVVGVVVDDGVGGQRRGRHGGIGTSNGPLEDAAKVSAAGDDVLGCEQVAAVSCHHGDCSGRNWMEVGVIISRSFRREGQEGPSASGHGGPNDSKEYNLLMVRRGRREVGLGTRYTQKNHRIGTCQFFIFYFSTSRYWTTVT